LNWSQSNRHVLTVAGFDDKRCDDILGPLTRIGSFSNDVMHCPWDFGFPVANSSTYGSVMLFEER